MSSPPPPTDHRAYRFPVSVKGVILRDTSVVLLHNERDEWELPGGKLEVGESPERCVVREIAEELGLEVEVVSILDSWVYEITPAVRVLIVTYGCQERRRHQAILSDEHTQLQWFPVHAVPALAMPAGYKQSILQWSRRLGLCTL